MPNVFDFNPTSINPFPYWKWNKVLPAVYDDSLSQYEILCKLLNVVNNIIDSTNSTGEQVEQLTQLVQQLIDGQFPSGIVQYVTDIVDAAMADDIERINAIIEEIQSTVDSFMHSIASVEHITNAYRQFKRVIASDDSPQGACPISFSNNYEYGQVQYFATMNGTDRNRRLEIRDSVGKVISTLGFPIGHYGSLSFNGSDKLYALNYTVNMPTRNTMYEVDISNINAPYISNTYTVDSRYNATFNFWYKDTMAIGYQSAGIVYLYKWDMVNDTYELITTLERKKYPHSGQQFAHYSYDEENDLFVQSGYGPNAFTVFDNNGNLINTVTIEEVLNFAKVGEIESLSIHDNKLWFSSRCNEGDFGDNTNRLNFFYFDCKAKNTGPFIQLENTSCNCHVSFDPDSDGGITFTRTGVTYAVANFNFFEDASNYAKFVYEQLGNDVSIYIDSDYPYIAMANGIHAQVLTNGGKLPALEVRNSTLDVQGGTLFTYDANNTILSGGSNFILWCYKSVLYLTSVPSSENAYKNFRFNKCIAQCRGITYSSINNSIVYCSSITNSAIDQYSCVMATSQSNNTVSSDSKVIV